MGSSTMATRLRAAAVVALAVLVAPSACTQDKKPPGQLVVAIDTDMALPDQIDTIEIVVTADGSTLLDYPMPVGAGRRHPADPRDVDARRGPGPVGRLPPSACSGWRNGVARTLRQVTTTVPTDRIATLRMPVQWLCDGLAQPRTDADGGAGYGLTCPPDQTCQAGSCVDSTVPPATLPTYQAQSVFGGGRAPAGKGTSTGTCFDTIACLVAGTVEAPDDQCTVAMPVGRSRRERRAPGGQRRHLRHDRHDVLRPARRQQRRGLDRARRAASRCRPRSAPSCSPASSPA